MRYDRVVEGKFLSRPNRFIAKVEVDGNIETVHVKNTGRCREILVPGCKTILYDSNNPERKTRYDLIAAYKDDMLINIDSQAPNKAFHEFILTSGRFGKDPKVFPEYTHGDSRFDFYIESEGRKIFVEVKGVTLEFDGVCSFPDAPTERGLKHLRGLRQALDERYECYAAFVVQMKPMRYFTPNYATHEEFGKVLEEVHNEGVGILVYDCIVTPDSMVIDAEVPFKFR
ncbi:DNA/RNA nuclease SfsA [Methanomassiliicoccales archaeon LGM-RCC1]|nr:DNA/RNA nuclease SfsA [Methanomassiliicoccales archaeon LGM-RCC1]